MKTLTFALSMLALGAFANGCIVDDSVRNPYEGCESGQACAGGTVCTAATFTTSGPGYFCTVGCTSACPVIGTNSAYVPTCVINTGGIGQCYDTCATNADCGLGTTCGNIPGTAALVCVPYGS